MRPKCLPKPTKLPFWHRHIPTPRFLQSKTFWRALGIAALAGFILLVLSPWLYGWIEWHMHPTVSMRGVSILMPRGWIQKSASWDSIEVENPGSILLRRPDRYLPSSLLITRNDLSQRTAQDYIRTFNQGQELINPTHDFGEFMATNSQGQQVRIHCGGGQLGLRCISMDGKWWFFYMGRLNEVSEVGVIMRAFVASSVPEWSPGR